MGISTKDKVTAGQAVYTPFLLSIYDYWVVQFSNKHFWRCPPELMQDLYDRNASSYAHLDIGVGTGYFLQHCQSITSITKVGLMDLNENSLRKTESVLIQAGVKNVEAVKADVLEAFPHFEADFESVGLNYLLHCVPGSFDTKLDSVLSNIKTKFAAGKTVRVFGSTILNDRSLHSGISMKVNQLYQWLGVFNNQQDSLADLHKVCEKYTDQFEISINGAVAFFELGIKA